MENHQNLTISEKKKIEQQKGNCGLFYRTG